MKMETFNIEREVASPEVRDRIEDAIKIEQKNSLADKLINWFNIQHQIDEMTSMILELDTTDRDVVNHSFITDLLGDKKVDDISDLSFEISNNTKPSNLRPNKYHITITHRSSEKEASCIHFKVSKEIFKFSLDSTFLAEPRALYKMVKKTKATEHTILKIKLCGTRNIIQFT